MAAATAADVAMNERPCLMVGRLTESGLVAIAGAVAWE